MLNFNSIRLGIEFGTLLRIDRNLHIFSILLVISIEDIHIHTIHTSMFHCWWNNRLCSLIGKKFLDDMVLQMKSYKICMQSSHSILDKLKDSRDIAYLR